MRYRFRSASTWARRLLGNDFKNSLQAFDAFGAMGGPALPILLEELKRVWKPSYGVVSHGGNQIKDLFERADADLRAKIADMIRGPGLSPDFRQFLVEVLGQHANSELVPAVLEGIARLAEAAKEPLIEDRARFDRLVDALEFVGRDAPEQVARGLGMPGVFEVAALALGHMELPSLARLAPVFEHPDGAVRAAAARFIGGWWLRSLYPEAHPILIRLARTDPDLEVCRTALEVLRPHEAADIELVLGLLDDPREGVAAAAARSLYPAAPASQVDRLIKALGVASPAARQVILKSLAGRFFTARGDAKLMLERANSDDALREALPDIIAAHWLQGTERAEALWERLREASGHGQTLLAAALNELGDRDLCGAVFELNSKMEKALSQRLPWAVVAVDNHPSWDVLAHLYEEGGDCGRALAGRLFASMGRDEAGKPPAAESPTGRTVTPKQPGLRPGELEKLVRNVARKVKALPTLRARNHRAWEATVEDLKAIGRRLLAAGGQPLLHEAAVAAGARYELLDDIWSGIG